MQEQTRAHQPILSEVAPGKPNNTKRRRLARTAAGFFGASAVMLLLNVTVSHHNNTAVKKTIAADKACATFINAHPRERKVVSPLKIPEVCVISGVADRNDAQLPTTASLEEHTTTASASIVDFWQPLNNEWSASEALFVAGISVMCAIVSSKGRLDKPCEAVALS